MTSTNSWLPLAEYSMKHQVSISTLRRRIKTEDIQFRFDDGKYFILDDEATKQVYADEHRPSLSRDAQPKSAHNLMLNQAMASVAAHPMMTNSHASYANHSAPQATQANAQTTQTEAGESVITAANRLLSDLKKAYTQVLHEKENQIQTLRQELADVNTLVKVLEFENEKLRNYNR